MSFFLITSSALTLAQNGGCIEVRGVETSLVKYTVENRTTEYYGFSFTNNNSFTVSIEADRWYNANNTIEGSKSFDLKPGESYVWKVNMYYDNCSGCISNPDRNYVKYKAFKCPR